MNEVMTLVDLEELVQIFDDLKDPDIEYDIKEIPYKPLGENLARTSSFMQQPQFNSITSET